VASIIGYGEDALTLWLLQKHPSRLLGQTYSKEHTRIYYRPSFGRGAHGYGEFDFIVLTKSKILLGECKWQESAEFDDGTVTLSEAQTERHRLFEDIYLKLENSKMRGGSLDASLAEYLELKPGQTLFENVKLVFESAISNGLRLEHRIVAFVPDSDIANVERELSVRWYGNKGMSNPCKGILCPYKPLENAERFLEIT